MQQLNVTLIGFFSTYFFPESLKKKGEEITNQILSFKSKVAISIEYAIKYFLSHYAFCQNTLKYLTYGTVCDFFYTLLTKSITDRVKNAQTWDRIRSFGIMLQYSTIELRWRHPACFDFIWHHTLYECLKVVLLAFRVILNLLFSLYHKFF